MNGGFWGRENVELVFHGYRIAVGEDEKTGSEWLNNFLKFIQLRVEIGFESV